VGSKFVLHSRCDWLKREIEDVSTEKTGIEYEKPNAYKPHYSFNHSLDLDYGHLVTSSDLSAESADETMMTPLTEEI